MGHDDLPLAISQPYVYGGQLVIRAVAWRDLCNVGTFWGVDRQYSRPDANLYPSRRIRLTEPAARGNAVYKHDFRSGPTMRFENVSVLGLAHAEAPNRIPSADFERRLANTMERLGMPPGMLQGLAGIESRRWWDEGVMPSDAATMAAEKVIEQTGIDRGRIGVPSIHRSVVEPSPPAWYMESSGSPSCLNFDSECLSGLYECHGGRHDARARADWHALVVDGESSRFVQSRSAAARER